MNAHDHMILMMAATAMKIVSCICTARILTYTCVFAVPDLSLSQHHCSDVCTLNFGYCVRVPSCASSCQSLNHSLYRLISMFFVYSWYPDASEIGVERQCETRSIACGYEAIAAGCKRIKQHMQKNKATHAGEVHQQVKASFNQTYLFIRKQKAGRVMGIKLLAMLMRYCDTRNMWNHC